MPSSAKVVQLNQIHDQLITSSLPLHKLFPFYVESGNIDYARIAFDRARVLFKFDRNAMLLAYSKNVLPERALLLFREMLAVGDRDAGPDKCSFTFFIAACSRLDRSCNCHSMVVQKGFERDTFVKNSLVSMCISFGAMVDARKLFVEMTEPGDVVTAMEGSAFMDEHDRGASIAWSESEAVARFLNMLDNGIKPDRITLNGVLNACSHSGLLSSMYASCNCWDGLARVGGSVCKQRIQLVLGWSSIEVKGVIHEFVAGNRTHLRAADIYQKLDEIFNRLQTMGYSPCTLQISLDLSEEDKEQAMYWHSEKLAVAFGLLSTEDGFPLELLRIFEFVKIVTLL
ncbi:pentatricopeptide repeat-containing protein At2g22070-like [Nymphaea colorata]|nr:pentatricopeptide repeat-containing protein At2g22070-like [Nymphaea colorata]